MALTQDSFRDPRRLYKLRVKSPCFITGREKPTEVGEVIALPRSQAAELIHSNKAVWHEDEPQASIKTAIPRADPPVLEEMKKAIPAVPSEVATYPDAKASAKSKEK